MVVVQGLVLAWSGVAGLCFPAVTIREVTSVPMEQQETEEELERWLDELRTEHRDLDDLIHLLQDNRHPDLMQIQRLKKRKLRLKDMIARLESKLIPDLDA